jgi:hypothetical protein
MPKSDFRTITYLKSNKSREFPLPPPNPTLKDPITTLEHHPPHMLSYLNSITDFHIISLHGIKT